MAVEDRVKAIGMFSAFREAVVEDHHLMLRLRGAYDRESFVARVVAVGAECGFAFDERAVRDALREGESAWLLQGTDLA